MPSKRAAVNAVPPEASDAPPLDSEASFVDIDGQRLEYRDIPPRASAHHAPVVMLHDGIGSLALWRDFPDKLAALTGRRVLAYSRAGHGDSSPATCPRSIDYMHDEALQVLPRLLVALAIDKPILFGHSDGASIALIHAANQPHAVESLILEAPHVFVEDLTIAGIRAAKERFETSDLANRLGRYHSNPSMTFWLWNDIWLRPEFRAWNIEAFLPSVSAPLLLIQGEDDDYGTAAQLHAIARQVSGTSEILLLANCGHSPHRNQEKAVLKKAADFMSTQD